MRVAVGLSLAIMLTLGTAAGLSADPLGTESSPAASRATAALKKAAKDNKYVFVLFFAKEDERTKAMKSDLETAVKKLRDRADSIVIDVADPAEKPIVERFRARGAPMPIVLAIAPTGAPTKAFPKQFGAADLKEAFVSPCTAKCMRAIFDQCSILLCVQNDKTKENKESLAGAKEFKNDPKYAKGTVIIMLDPADKAEQRFLKDLEVDPRTEKAVAVLVMPPGAPVATFKGAFTKEAVEKAVEAAKASCPPGCKCH